MRYQGRIGNWENDQDFGFIIPNGGADKVFVDINAFVQRKLRPNVNQAVSYELVTDPTKGLRAEDVRYVGPRDASYVVPRDELEVPEREPFFKQFIFVVFAVAVGLYGWERYQERNGRVERNQESAPAAIRETTSSKDNNGSMQGIAPKATNGNGNRNTSPRTGQ